MAESDGWEVDERAPAVQALRRATEGVTLSTPSFRASLKEKARRIVQAVNVVKQLAGAQSSVGYRAIRVSQHFEQLVAATGISQEQALEALGLKVSDGVEVLDAPSPRSINAISNLGLDVRYCKAAWRLVAAGAEVKALHPRAVRLAGNSVETAITELDFAVRQHISRDPSVQQRLDAFDQQLDEYVLNDES